MLVISLIHSFLENFNQALVFILFDHDCHFTYAFSNQFFLIQLILVNHCLFSLIKLSAGLLQVVDRPNLRLILFLLGRLHMLAAPFGGHV